MPARRAHPDRCTPITVKSSLAPSWAAEPGLCLPARQAAVAVVEADGGLDVLINNAGLAAEWSDHDVVIGLEDVTADVMRRTFETNVFGTVRVTHAFLPLPRRSTAPVVVNVSSGLASPTRVTTPAYAYPSRARCPSIDIRSGQRAEAEGFEPPDPCGTLAFKASAFGRSATLPPSRLASRAGPTAVSRPLGCRGCPLERHPG